MQDISSEHINELSMLPKEYTIKMALDNNDILKYGVIPYNARRLELFMLNYHNQTPDKVRITDYGIDNFYPNISILEYDGNNIFYTTRYYKYEEDNPTYQSYIGYSMNEKYRKKDDKVLRDYNLVTYDLGELRVFIELL